MVCPLPSSFRNGSEAAVIGHLTEHRGDPWEHGRISSGSGQSTGERFLRSIRKSLFGLKGSYLGLGFIYLSARYLF